MTPHSKSCKASACLLALSVLITSFLPTTTLNASTAIPSSADPSLRLEAKDLSRLQPSNALGKVEKLYRAPQRDRFVILIQDAHAIPEAQKNIRLLIERFQKEYSIDLIGLEGAAGKLDPTLLRNFPDKEILKKVFNDYLDSGELAGAAVASVLNPEEADYYGIEDGALYQKGIEQFLEALRLQPGLLERLSSLKDELRRLKAEHYSKTLQDLDQKIESFKEEKLELTAFLERLAAPSFSPAAKQYPHLSVVFEELRKKEAAVRPHLSREIEAIFQQTRRGLKDRNQVAALNAKRQDYQTDRISLAGFASYLMKEAQEAGISQKISTELQRSVQHQDRLEKLSGSEFFEELESYLGAFKKSLFRSKIEAEIDQRDREIRRLEKLAKLELSREEWKKIKGQVARGKGQDLTGVPDPWHLTLDPLLIHPFLEFYKTSEARDEALLRNALKLMKERKKNRILLVAGGFHSQALASLLEKEGISYAIISPAINHIPEETHYFNYMRGDVSWKKYFEVENGKVNLYKAFVRATRDRLLNIDPRSKMPAYRPGRQDPSRTQKPLPGSGILSATEPSDGSAAFSGGDPGLLLKRWRDEILRNLSAKGESEKSGRYTKFIDEAYVKSLPREEYERLKQEWLAKVQKLIAGIRLLKTENKLTAANLVRLASANTQFPVAVGSLVPRSYFQQPPQPPAAATAGRSRSEVRKGRKRTRRAGFRGHQEIPPSENRPLFNAGEIKNVLRDGLIRWGRLDLAGMVTDWFSDRLFDSLTESLNRRWTEVSGRLVMRIYDIVSTYLRDDEFGPEAQNEYGSTGTEVLGIPNIFADLLVRWLETQQRFYGYDRIESVLMRSKARLVGKKNPTQASSSIRRSEVRGRNSYSLRDISKETTPPVPQYVRPAPPLRLRLLAPILVAGYKLFMRSRLEVKIHNLENLPERQFLGMANHMSLLDHIVFVFETYIRKNRLVLFVAKTKHLPWYQRFLVRLGAAINIEPSSKDETEDEQKARWQRNEALIKQKLREGWDVAIFPGGRIAVKEDEIFAGWEKGTAWDDRAARIVSDVNDEKKKEGKPPIVVVPIAFSGRILRQGRPEKLSRRLQRIYRGVQRTHAPKSNLEISIGRPINPEGKKPSKLMFSVVLNLGFQLDGKKINGELFRMQQAYKAASHYLEPADFKPREKAVIQGNRWDLQQEALSVGGVRSPRRQEKMGRRGKAKAKLLRSELREEESAEEKLAKETWGGLDENLAPAITAELREIFSAEELIRRQTFKRNLSNRRISFIVRDGGRREQREFDLYIKLKIKGDEPSEWGVGYPDRGEGPVTYSYEISAIRIDPPLAAWEKKETWFITEIAIKSPWGDVRRNGQVSEEYFSEFAPSEDQNSEVNKMRRSEARSQALSSPNGQEIERENIFKEEPEEASVEYQTRILAARLPTIQSQAIRWRNRVRVTALLPNVPASVLNEAPAYGLTVYYGPERGGWKDVPLTVSDLGLWLHLQADIDIPDEWQNEALEYKIKATPKEGYSRVVAVKVRKGDREEVKFVTQPLEEIWSWPWGERHNESFMELLAPGDKSTSKPLRVGNVQPIKAKLAELLAELQALGIHFYLSKSDQIVVDKEQRLLIPTIWNPKAKDEQSRIEDFFSKYRSDKSVSRLTAFAARPKQETLEIAVEILSQPLSLSFKGGSSTSYVQALLDSAYLLKEFDKKNTSWEVVTFNLPDEIATAARRQKVLTLSGTKQERQTVLVNIGKYFSIFRALREKAAIIQELKGAPIAILLADQDPPTFRLVGPVDESTLKLYARLLYASMAAGESNEDFRSRVRWHNGDIERPALKPGRLPIRRKNSEKRSEMRKAVHNYLSFSIQRNNKEGLSRAAEALKILSSFPFIEDVFAQEADALVPEYIAHRSGLGISAEVFSENGSERFRFDSTVRVAIEQFIRQNPGVRFAWVQTHDPHLNSFILEFLSRVQKVSRESNQRKPQVHIAIVASAEEMTHDASFFKEAQATGMVEVIQQGKTTAVRELNGFLARQPNAFIFSLPYEIERNIPRLERRRLLRRENISALDAFPASMLLTAVAANADRISVELLQQIPDLEVFNRSVLYEKGQLVITEKARDLYLSQKIQSARLIGRMA